jgi:hypothetical protein
VFKYGVLRKIFGTKRDGVTEWRKLHTEEIHDLYSSPNVIRTIILRRMRWVVHVARILRVLCVSYCGVYPSKYPQECLVLYNTASFSYICNKFTLKFYEN